MRKPHNSPEAIPRSRVGFYGLLDQLRGLAALSVVWAHLVGYFLEASGRSWPPFAFVERFFQVPLGIVGDFGYFGVSLFFFISGFVITHAGTRESGTEFIVKRVLRIYPPLIFAISLVLFLAWFAGGPLAGVDTASLTVVDVLSNFSLANYVYQPRTILLTVTWTLAVEMMFYLFMWALRGLLVRRAIVVSPLILLGILVLILTRDLSSSSFIIAHTAVAVALLVIGQLCYLVATKRIPLWVASLYGVAAWGLYIYGTGKLTPERLADGNLFPQNAVLAFLAFLTAVLVEGRLRPSKLLGVVAKRSYSLYLVHASLGLTILGALNAYTKVPYTVALLVAVIAVGIVTEISYRFVERPSIRLGKYLSGRIRSSRAGSNPPVGFTSQPERPAPDDPRNLASGD